MFIFGIVRTNFFSWKFQHLVLDIISDILGCHSMGRHDITKLMVDQCARCQCYHVNSKKHR